MTHEEYLSHDGTALAEFVRAGDVTATELLDIALERIEALNPKLNAVVRLMEDGRDTAAHGDTSGVFCGVPFLAKDLASGYAGHPTSTGSRLLKDFVIDHDTELAARVRATGVTIAGKTNLPEWGLVPYTESELWGPCRNPWHTDRTPGGSSGGSAAAVAAGIVPMAGGGDGGGSIRIPASCCGIFGLKPTRGRTPTGPDYGQLWRGAVVEHVLTRSVRDSAMMLDATHGPDPGAPFEIAPPERPFSDEVGREPGRLRIAWTAQPTLGSAVDPACIAAVEDAVALLQELGHELVPATPTIDGSQFAQAFLTMVAAELGADLADAEHVLAKKPKRSELEPLTWALGLVSRAVSGREFAMALRVHERIARDVGRFFVDYDVLLTPTLATPPPEIGELAPTAGEQAQLRLLGRIGSAKLIKAAGLLDQMAKGAFEFTPWTPIYNVTGQPAMSVPLHWTETGLPIGVHFAARFGDEATLLRLAGQLERARPWFDTLPELATTRVSAR
jgi:amidase